MSSAVAARPPSPQTPSPQTPSQTPPVPPAASPASLRWWLALPLAVLGGYALDAATPWLDWWPAGLIGAGLIIAALWQQRARFGFIVGLLAGASFWMPNIHWLTLYLGPIPWLALCSLMIAWFGLFGLLTAAATRGLTRLLPNATVSPNGGAVPNTAAVPSTVLLPLAQSLIVAGLWVAREQVQSSWPYGGFAWGRIAVTQADGPMAPLVSWLGFAGLSGLMVFACALAVAVLARRGISRTRRLLVLAAIPLCLAGLALVPPAALTQTGTLRIAAVQGDSKSAIFDDRENGEVIRDHIDATEALLDELEASGQSVDLIVWPENSGEFQLPEQHDRVQELRRLSERAGAPIVVGSILNDPDGSYTNSTLVFDARGDTGLRYDKRRPVPFAEYMPNRPFFHALVPDLVDLVQLDYGFGARPAVLPIDTPAGSVRAGVAICFDIIFDDHAVALMHGDARGASGAASDAQLILAQTNNADFGRSDESAQQLQIATLRAIETGRTLVNISTVGTSAIVLPDGSELDRLTPFTADAMVAEVPLVTGQTPALRYGAVIAGAWIALGLFGTAAGVCAAGRRRGSAGAAAASTRS